MTVATNVNKITYQANGAVTKWPFIFPVLNASHLKVIVTDPAGEETTLESNYYVDLQTSAVTYPVTGAPLAAGNKITLLRLLPAVQNIDLENQGPFEAETLERGYDYLTMLVQQLDERTHRAILGPVAGDDPPADMVSKLLAASARAQAAAQTAQSSAASSAEQSAASANAAAASQQSAAQSAEAAAQTAQSVNQWCHRGEWASGTDYLSGEGYIDVVEHDGSSYVCLAAHQATTANEPGVGANSADFWRLLAEKGQPGFVFTPALVDGVLNWTNNGGLSNPASVDLFKAPTEDVQDLGTRTGNTTINCALGNYVIMTIGASLTLSFTAAANGRLRVLTLELINGGSATVTWPASVKWADGAAPVLTAAGKDLITLMTRDDGATWYGTVVGSDFK